MDFFERIEKVLKLHGDNSYLGDVDKPGAADYLVWPWIERSQAFKILGTGKAVIIFFIGICSFFI